MSNNKKKTTTKNKVTPKEEVIEEKVDLEKEIDNSIKEEVSEKKNNKRKRHFVLGFLSFILFLIAGLFFVTNLFINNGDGNNLFILVNSIILALFTICFIISVLTRNRNITGFGILLLIGYFVFNTLINTGYITYNSFNKVDDFSNMSLSKVIEWASSNNITINQEYEYSDMVEEYNVISQDVKAGTNLKDVSEITVAISEGPNPAKNIFVPNMNSWDSERVIKFVNDNYLSNVIVGFVESENKVDTVIDQNTSGNMNRNDELRLDFSYGEELGYDEYALIDFKNKSKFEAMFFCKQHQIECEFKEGFSKKIKKGNAYKQSIEPGKKVKVNSDKVTIYISKGPKIIVPDFKGYSLEKIANWSIKNRLKIKISDKYDDSVKINNVISTNHNKGDVLSQGDTIEVVISKGPLKMKKFKSLDAFREWADKYSIKYEIQNEFSNNVPAGEVISYSYKVGDTIKNEDSIIVKVSDGKKIEVPNLEGLTKNEAIKKLKEAGLNYNFVYKSSNDVSEGKVISQSMRAGSEVGKGSTITVTISSGKNTNKREESNNNSNNNSNNSSGNSGNNSGGNTPPAPPVNTCVPKTYVVSGGLRNVFINNSGYAAVSSALYSFFASNYPNVKISVVGVDGGDASSGSFVGGIKAGSSITSCNDVPYTIQIAK